MCVVYVCTTSTYTWCVVCMVRLYYVYYAYYT